MKQHHFSRHGDHVRLKFMGGISEELHRHILGRAGDGLAV
jgi:hypothetical protein